jgi:hypothetical protein
MMYNPFKKTLSFYVNGKYLGTPFENVDGDLYVCLEVCHTGSFTLVENPSMPAKTD